MNDTYIKKICLGTAQFGLDYGIANKNGKVSGEEALKILEYAYRSGIDTIDTGSTYGTSECVLGDLISNSNIAFKIISKTPYLDNDENLELERHFTDSAKRLKSAKIYGYLLLRFENLLQFEDRLWKKIESLKSAGLVEKIGLSLYKTSEMDYILNKKMPFDIIQAPYSIFDQRFKKYFPVLKNASKEIYVRSVFLQGLFFADTALIEKKFSKAKHMIKKLYSISTENNIPVHSLCLLFALLDPFADKVIIGVDSLEQLKQNIDSVKYIEKIKDIYNSLESLNFHDEEVLLPCNWGK